MSLGYTVEGTGPSAKVTTQVTDRRGKTSFYQHNAAGQLTSYKDPANHETLLEYGAYGDNEHGLVTRLTLPSGRTVAYEYDKAQGDPDGAQSPPFTLPNVLSRPQRPQRPQGNPPKKRPKNGR